MNYRRRLFLWTTVTVFAGIVFIADLNSPHGVAEWVLYLPLVLAPVLFNSARQVVVMTVACTALSIVGFSLSPLGVPFWGALGNRLMGLMAMWLTAISGIFICRGSNQVSEAMRNLQREVAHHLQTRRALEHNEERLRLVMQGAGMGTWDEDMAAGNVIWSANLFRMFGYRPAPNGKATRAMWWSLVHPDDRDRVLEAQEQAQRQRSVYCPEYRIIRADNGAIVWLAVIGHFTFEDNNKADRFLGVAFDITRRKELEREVLEIAAREQEQIGQELHDGVGQELTGLGLMAQSLAQRLPESAAEKRIATRLIAGLDQVHENVRELSRGLIPVHVEARGLPAALDDLAARTTEQSGILVTSDCPEWVEMPDHSAATQLFRIAQEAVSNALRHGRPRQIRMTLLAEPAGLKLRITDDGVGIQDRPAESDGIGLRIMQYRAGLIGGVLRIEPAAGGGTVVMCTLSRRTNDDGEEPASSRGASQDTYRG